MRLAAMLVLLWMLAGCATRPGDMSSSDARKYATVWPK